MSTRPLFAIAGTVVAVTIVLASCAAADEGEPGAGSSASPSTASAGDAPQAESIAPAGVAVVGDSNSTGFSGTLEAGLANGTAWAAQLSADRFPLVGGWAVDGATTAQMLEGIRPQNVDASRVIVMGGTNDLSQGVPLDAIEITIRRIVEASGAPTATILAIAPSDAFPAQALALNSRLQSLTRDEGWDFCDPWVPHRQADGTWSPRFATDGVHTSSQGYALAGMAVREHLDILSG